MLQKQKQNCKQKNKQTTQSTNNINTRIFTETVSASATVQARLTNLKILPSSFFSLSGQYISQTSWEKGRS